MRLDHSSELDFEQLLKMSGVKIIMANDFRVQTEEDSQGMCRLFQAEIGGEDNQKQTGDHMPDQNEKRFMIDLNAANSLKMESFPEAEIEMLPPEFKRLFKPIHGRRRFNLPLDLDRRFLAGMMALGGQRMGVDLRRYLTPHTQIFTPDMKKHVDASLQVLGSEVLTIVLGRILEAAPPQVIEKIQRDIASNFGLRSESPSQHSDRSQNEAQ